MPNQPYSNGDSPLDAHSEAHDSLSKGQPASGDTTSPRLAPPKAASPQLLASTILDRLNAQIEQEQTQVEPNLHHELLIKIGSELRRWRIRSGYTRQTLASALCCTVAELLALESGLTSPSRPASDHLSSDHSSSSPTEQPEDVLLNVLLKQESLDNSLRLQIQRYLNPSH